MVDYKGKRLTIRYCEQPEGEDDLQVWRPPSLHKALSHFPGGKGKNAMATMAARRKYLADQGQLRAPDHWNTEAKLPNDKHFFAIKAGKLRAYGWFSDRHKGVFFISHFAFKRGPKLSKEDERLVIRNWREIEEK
jgi:hypothetical protein